MVDILLQNLHLALQTFQVVLRFKYCSLLLFLQLLQLKRTLEVLVLCLKSLQYFALMLCFDLLGLVFVLPVSEDSLLLLKQLSSAFPFVFNLQRVLAYDLTQQLLLLLPHLLKCISLCSQLARHLLSLGLKYCELFPFVLKHQGILLLFGLGCVYGVV